MERACVSKNTNWYEKTHASSLSADKAGIRPIKINFIRMKTRILIGLVVLCIGISGCRRRGAKVDRIQTIQLPTSEADGLYLEKEWKFDGANQIGADYLLISGGIDNIDKGSPGWGTTDPSKFRMIGDYGGEIRIMYDNGSADTIPLVYGYTLWFKNNWIWGKEPFITDTSASALLTNTLFLKNLYNRNEDYILKIRLRKRNIRSIGYFDNQLKDGLINQWRFQFTGVRHGKPMADRISVRFDTSDVQGFFNRHTIDTVNTYPLCIKNNLRKLMYLLYTFSFDYAGVKKVDIPQGYEGPSIIFSGEPEAVIISSVFHHNLNDQISRVDTSGLVHESAFMSPSWFYDGFGTWADTIGENYNGSYYNCYYTRNKTIMILSDLGYIDASNRALSFLDKLLMYFPENYPLLQLEGNRIPGHWTVIANKPLVYSHVLTHVGWPTQYAFKKFGKHYRDFGNPETDGHGHSMMSHWKTWQNSGRSKQWVLDRWKFLKEAADYICWSLHNPGLSFSKHGLLYAESEAGMCDYTMYCNFPCYLGLLMYAEMADSIGASDYSRKWRDTALQLQKDMQAYFASHDSIYGKIWQKVGFYHENILTVLKEYYGFDLTPAIPVEWMERSMNTYLKDKESRPDFYGPMGIGYDHNILTQTAMLLDRMDDVTKWMENLAHLCYAPRLPKPYIVPECASVDVERGIIRRQGDLGNGIQQAETINSILICAGIDDNVPGTLKIMPRLPEKWDMRISDYPVIVYADGKSYTSKFNMNITYPCHGIQSVKLRNVAGGTLKNVNFRLGPFPADTKSVKVLIDKKGSKTYPCYTHGDRAWCWIQIPEIRLSRQISIETAK